VHGGHRYGCFFFIQAIEYITAFNESLPDADPSPEEVNSGLTRLSEDFGFFATLTNITGGVPSEMERVCQEWSTREFYHLVRYRSFESHALKEYQRLIAMKK
jgi:hypothetical protein